MSPSLDTATTAATTADWAWKRNFYELVFNYLPPALLAFGLASNTCAFLVLMRPKMRFLVVHLPLLVLSVVDSIALLTGLLRHWLRKATYLVAVGDLDPQATSQTSCKLLELLLYLSLMYSSWLVTLISVERYVTVCVQQQSRVRAFLISRRGLCWTMCSGFIALLGVNLHFLATRGLVLPGPDYNQTSTTESVTVEDKVVIEDDKDAVCRNLDQHEFFVETVFPMLDLTLTAFVPFLVIATCNIKIVCKLRDVRKNSGLSASQSAFGGYRTTVMLLLTTFVFIALTAPVKIYLTVIGGSQPSGLDAKSDPNRFYSHRVVWSIMIALQFANHCCNFLLYCASNPKFRSEAVGLFSTCCFCCSGRRCSCCFCRLNDGSNYRNQRALSYLSPDGSADEQLEEQRQRRRQDSLQFHGQELSATYSGPACTNENDMPMRSRAPTVQSDH